MKKSNERPPRKQQPGRALKHPAGVIEVTEQDLEGVQGGHALDQAWPTKYQGPQGDAKA